MTSFRLADYQADLVRYRKKRREALDAGYADEHPLVRVHTRRIAAVSRMIELLGGKVPDDDTDQAV